MIVLTAEEKDLTITDDLTELVRWETVSYGSRTEANSQRSTAEHCRGPRTSESVKVGSQLE